MATHAPERLPQTLHLVVEPLAMILGQSSQQPAIEFVAIAGDPWQEFGQRQRGLVGAGAVAGEARGHQHHAGEHRRRLATQLCLPLGALVERRRGGSVGPGQDPVECRLLDDHPPIEAALVDPCRIPEAEQIVGAARGGMEKVEGTRIDREFLEHREIEVGLLKQTGRRGRENLDGARHEIPILSLRGAGTGHEQWDRPHPFVRIGFREPAIF